MDRRRSIVRLAAAAAVTTAALWLAARNVHIDRVRVALGAASFVWLLPYPFICIVLNVIRGEIWRMLLGRRVTTAQAFWAYSVGFLANNVLPFRLGEAVRVVVLSRRSELPVVEVAAAAGLERLLDMTALSLMLALLGPALAGVPGFMRAATLVAMLAGVALLAIVALIRFRRQSRIVFERAIGWMPARAGRIAVERWNDLTRGLAVLLKPSVGFPAAGGAVVVWILTVVLQWLVLRAFQPAAGAADAAFMVAAVSLAIALPAAPGFIGVYHWAGQQTLIAAFPERYDPSMALAAVTVSHALSFMTSTAIGIGGLWYFGMPPSAMANVLRDGDRTHVPVDGAAVEQNDPHARITR